MICGKAPKHDGVLVQERMGTRTEMTKARRFIAECVRSPNGGQRGQCFHKRHFATPEVSANQSWRKESLPVPSLPRRPRRFPASLVCDDPVFRRDESLAAGVVLGDAGSLPGAELAE